MNAGPAPDYWVVRHGGAYAVRSVYRDIEISVDDVALEGIKTLGEARDHILDLEARDRAESQDEQAGLDDFEAQFLAEAA